MVTPYKLFNAKYSQTWITILLLKGKGRGGKGREGEGVRRGESGRGREGIEGRGRELGKGGLFRGFIQDACQLLEMEMMTLSQIILVEGVSIENS